jgi:hypothetical protein
MQKEADQKRLKTIHRVTIGFTTVVCLTLIAITVWLTYESTTLYAPLISPKDYTDKFDRI